MNTIRFSCQASFALAPNELAEQILDVSNWSDFQGYGPLPGIESAKYEIRTPEVVGSRIAVQNRDGSSHVEEITQWLPKSRVVLQMQQFSAPLSRLASHIDETWDLSQVEGKTLLVRSLEIHPHNSLTRMPLWIISKLLKRAIARHLRQMGGQQATE